jgi:hypothetical protein
MKRISALLFQIDEACRLITDGRQEHLRLALLLLDNAIELQMDWAIRNELWHHEYIETLRSRVLRIPEEGRGPDLQWLVDWQPLGRSRRSKIERDFNEKVDYLVSLPEGLPPSISPPLKYLHRYRNEAYHRGRVRPATLALACRLLVEINCEALMSLEIHGCSIASDEEYSWLEHRFGAGAMQLLGAVEHLRQTATDDFRAKALPSLSSLRDALAEHVESRVADIRDALEFIAENTIVSGVGEAFRASQYWAAVKRGEIAEPTKPSLPSTYVPRFDVSVLDTVLGRRDEIQAATTRLEAFGAYSAIEQILEAFEDDVFSVSADVDRVIDDEITRRRK